MSAAGDKIIAGLEEAVAHSKGPQFTTELEMRVSNLPSANNSFHLYLADKRGRKVAALWGGNDEKLANGYLFSAAEELYNLARHFERVAEYELRQIQRVKPEDDEGVRLRQLSLNLIRATIAKARGEA